MGGAAHEQGVVDAHGGPGPNSRGLKTPSTMSRVASPTRASKLTLNSNRCPKVGTSSPPCPSSKPRQSSSSGGRGGSRCVAFGLTPD